MASISKSLNDAVYSPIHLSTKGTCRQREYWEMARRVRIVSSNPYAIAQPYAEFYTRNNVARIIEATPVTHIGQNYDGKVFHPIVLHQTIFIVILIYKLVLH